LDVDRDELDVVLTGDRVADANVLIARKCDFAGRDLRIEVRP
jgi:hypothetical protein